MKLLFDKQVFKKGDIITLRVEEDSMTEKGLHLVEVTPVVKIDFSDICGKPDLPEQKEVDPSKIEKEMEEFKSYMENKDETT